MKGSDSVSCPGIKICKKEVTGDWFEKYCDGNYEDCPEFKNIKLLPKEWYYHTYGDEPV